MEQEVEPRVGYDRYMAWDFNSIIVVEHNEFNNMRVNVVTNGPFVTELIWNVEVDCLEQWLEKYPNQTELNLDSWFGILKLTRVEVKILLKEHKLCWRDDGTEIPGGNVDTIWG